MTDPRPGGPMFTGRLSFLSNFYEGDPFDIPGLGAAATGEHAFNALKAVRRADAERVLSAPTPALAKRAGRAVALRPGWDAGLRVLAMQAVIDAKFSSELMSLRLAATGLERLVETNVWHDQFWGSCLCPRHAGVPGTNMLGELLMARRARGPLS